MHERSEHIEEVKVRTYAFQSCIPVMKTVLAARASKIPTKPDKNIKRISCHTADTNAGINLHT